MTGFVNGIPHAQSTDRLDLWPATSRDVAEWIDDNVPRNDDPRLSNARTPVAHDHPITDVTGLQTALDRKVDGDDDRLSDPRPPTAHDHDDRYYTESEINTLLDTRLAEPIALDDDMVPYFTLQGSAIAQDTDGVPYFTIGA